MNEIIIKKTKKKTANWNANFTEIPLYRGNFETTSTLMEIESRA